jgi:hypothetical protein
MGDVASGMTIARVPSAIHTRLVMGPLWTLHRSGTVPSYVDRHINLLVPPRGNHRTLPARMEPAILTLK